MSHPPWLGEQSKEATGLLRKAFLLGGDLTAAKGTVQCGKGVIVWMGHGRLSPPAFQ